MKTFKLFVALAVLISVSMRGMAQDHSGLYLTSDDFIHNRLTYPLGKNKSDKIQLNSFFSSAKGYVVSGGKKYAFDKGQVYGYRKNGSSYRFYQHSIYRIVDTAGYYIYYKYEPVEKEKGKGLVKEDEYFFSATENAPIIQLNLSTVCCRQSAYSFIVNSNKK